MIIKIEDIAIKIDAQFINSGVENGIDKITIDSRSLLNTKNTVFFALAGKQQDAHRYIPELMTKGVQNFVVTHIPENCDGKANFLIVKDTLTALQKFATYYRRLFNFPVIGITGSNGKTIVKEWLAFLLSPEYNIIKSPKSYNSQIGVPLSIIGINEQHDLGIFEAGISTTSEMNKLEKIIRPTIGILTNIGSAHDEGFATTNEKIKEKLELFKNVGVLILKKNKTIDKLIDSSINTFSWSFDDESADVKISKKNDFAECVLSFSYKERKYKIKIPFQDEASIENAVSCLLLLLYLKYDIKVVRKRFKLLYPVEMRLKVKRGINNCTLIDDSYSSDYQSLRIALDFLESQKKHTTKTLILSDIFQSGLTDESLYAIIGELVVSNKINRIIGIGKTISSFQHHFSNCFMCKNTETFLSQLDKFTFENETILIKGARSFEFEKIVAALEEKTHETILEINLNAITHNLNYYKSKINPTTKIMVMVKAFGYGNGGFEIAKLLEYHQVDYLGVAFADEGISLRNSGIRMPIMVLNPESTSFDAIIQHRLEPEIYNLKGLLAFIKIAEQKNISHFPIHIKLDTGMHRLGFEEDTIFELIAVLKNNKHVMVKSILSHLATSDMDEFTEFSLHQIRLFEKLSSILMKELQINPIRHILNTSGIAKLKEAQYDMVRLGIGLYGISNEPDEQPFLENVSSLKSVISQIRKINPGESVSYGRRFIAQVETKVATIPIGYADGITRLWGNGVGYVIINHKKASILGSICMDMLMVDITTIDCKEGDTVTIFGESPTVNEIAQKTNTIPYEILTSISQRVKRIFYRE